MSLVQAIITDNFVLVGGDNRAILTNGIVMENCNKVIKLNDTIILGCTGDVSDNCKLFSNYCFYSPNFGIHSTKEKSNVSYNDFIDLISENFKLMYKEYLDKCSNKRYDINSFICGFNGTEFEARCFALGHEDEIQNGFFSVKKAVNFPYKGVNAGKQNHLVTLQEFVQNEYFKYGKLTIRQYKNILQEVFNRGKEIDSSINNTIHFEKIRKKDIIGG